MTSLFEGIAEAMEDVTEMKNVERTEVIIDSGLGIYCPRGEKIRFFVIY